MPTIAQIQDGIADQLGSVLGTIVTNLQIAPRLLPNPTPPSIDIYPSDPFTEQLAYGGGNRQYWFTVRARVTTADVAGGQDLLLAMMDDGEPESVEAALLATNTIAGVRMGQVEGPGGFQPYVNIDSSGQLLGCIWRVSFIP